jgi:hypothetical protein
LAVFGIEFGILLFQWLRTKKMVGVSLANIKLIIQNVMIKQ